MKPLSSYAFRWHWTTKRHERAHKKSLYTLNVGPCECVCSRNKRCAHIHPSRRKILFFCTRSTSNIELNCHSFHMHAKFEKWTQFLWIWAKKSKKQKKIRRLKEITFGTYTHTLAWFNKRSRVICTMQNGKNIQWGWMEKNVKENRGEKGRREGKSARKEHSGVLDSVLDNLNNLWNCLMESLTFCVWTWNV